MMTYNRPVEALLYFRDSVKYRPENVHSWVMLGEANVEAYKLHLNSNEQTTSKGYRSWTKALSLNPKYIYAHTLLYKSEFIAK